MIIPPVGEMPGAFIAPGGIDGTLHRFISNGGSSIRTSRGKGDTEHASEEESPGQEGKEDLEKEIRIRMRSRLYAVRNELLTTKQPFVVLFFGEGSCTCVAGLGRGRHVPLRIYER